MRRFDATVKPLFGAAITFVVAPETARRSLEVINGDSDAAIAGHARSG